MIAPPTTLLEVALAQALSAADPASPALVVEDDAAHVMTYGELNARIACLRPQLRRLGVKPGCAITVYTARTPDAIALTLAAVLEGAPFCHHDTPYGTAQLARAIEQSRSMALFVDDLGLEALARDAPALLAAQRPIYLPTTGSVVAPPAQLPRLSLDDPAKATGLEVRGTHRITEHAGTMCFTSGSTGVPKCIVLPGHAYVANAASDAATYGMHAGDRILHMLSIGHSYGIIQLFSTLLARAALHLFSSVVVKKADFIARLRAITERSRITGFHFGASLFHTFAVSAGNTPILDAGTTVRFVSLAGAPLSAPQVAQIRTVVAPTVALYKEYGQGEVSRLAVRLTDGSAADASVGTALPGNHIFVTPDGERVATPGEPGEIVVISPARAMLGYLGDGALSADGVRSHPAFPGQAAIYTGDSGYLDDEGRLFVLGRKGGAFKRNWVLIYPEVVESELLRHPDIAEAAVFGIEIAGAAQPGRTIAIVRTSRETTAEAIIVWAREHMTPTHLPDKVVLWSELPRLSGGKLAREEIKARYLAARS